MAASVNQVLAQVERWAADAVLLRRYAQEGDQAAFAALVARHGPLVLRLCCRILGDVHAAEDALQAVFLILARKAHALKQPDSLPAWLYGVARRVALKARCRDRRTTVSVVPTSLTDPRPDPLTQLTARELLDILDEEIGRLPAAQRSAVILCCLEGLSREEAACILGWTPGAIKGHLQRGRQRLQDRLARRGIALSAALVLATVPHGEAATALLRKTATTALNGGIGSSASVLAHNVLKTMLLTQLAGMAALLLTVALAASASFALIHRGPVTPTAEDKSLPVVVAKEADAAEPSVRTDALGDPLPRGAIARLGTVRLRHGDSIGMVRFTPDGKRLVSQGADGVRVWDAISGKELRHLQVLVGGADLSPDGKCIAGVNPGFGPVELWDVDSGKKIAALGEICFAPIRFSPDGKLLATLGIESKVDIWQVETRKKLRSWKVPAKHVGSFVFTPDSRQLLTNGFYDMVRVWDVATGQELQDFMQLPAAAGTITLPLPPALSSDGKLIALLERDAKETLSGGKIVWKARISLRDMATNKLLRELTYPTSAIGGAPLPFRALMFAPDGKSLIVAGPDFVIRLLDVQTGKELRRIVCKELLGSLTLSPDGTKLAVVMTFGTAMQILDLKSGQAKVPPAGHLTPIPMAALSPDGRTAVTGSVFGPVFLWDATTGQPRRRLDNRHHFLDTLQLSGNGQMLFTSGEDKKVRLWNVATGAEERYLDVNRAFSHAANEITNHWLALAPDGKMLAAMGADKTIRILDAATGAEWQHFQGPEKLLGMGWTSNGRSLVVWSGDLKVRVWDPATGRKFRQFSYAQDSGVESGPNDHYRFALSHNGRLLAIGVTIENNQSEDLTSSVILKDLATGQVVHRIGKLPARCSRVAFSPDDRMLAWTGWHDPTIRLLETAGGGERRRLAGHRGRIIALTFSADGRRLLSGCNDTTALVWDLSAPAQPPPDAAVMGSLWNDLCGIDAARAYRAIQTFASFPSLTVPFMQERLHPIAAVDEKHLARLLADLDSDAFATREKASAELAKLGEWALPAYRRALQSKPSLESRRRLEDLREKAQAAYWDASGERLRSLRAVEALERAGTPEAREVLKSLAAGAEGARVTEQAQAALERLANGRRSSVGKPSLK